MANVFQSASGSSTNNLRTGTSWKSARLLSYSCKGSLAFLPLLDCETRTESGCFHTFQRWHSAKAFSCTGNIRFLHGLLDLSQPIESCSLVDPHYLVGVDPELEHRLGSFCLHVLSKDGLPNAHDTAPLDLSLPSLLDPFWFKHSATHVIDKDSSSAKQSSCGDGQLGMQHLRALAHACQAPLQKHFRTMSRAPL